MPIPAFDQNGFLPEGVHECTLEEIAMRFGIFQGSERRTRLMDKLETFMMEARAANFARWVLVDGSFVTRERSPNDIDLVLVLPASHDAAADLSPVQYNLVSRRRVQKRYAFDVVTVRENTSAHEEAVAFFQQIRGHPALRKGLLRIQL